MPAPARNKTGRIRDFPKLLGLYEPSTKDSAVILDEGENLAIEFHDWLRWVVRP